MSPYFKGIEQRPPYQSELDYFNKNPHVAGMAAEDDRIILNPYSTLKPEQMNSVLMNESARIFMRKGKRPGFSLTDEQKDYFGLYSSDEQDTKETIAARILSGDTSAGRPTDEQLRYVNEYLRGSLFSEE
jgi:hypothetical protein